MRRDNEYDAYDQPVELWDYEAQAFVGSDRWQSHQDYVTAWHERKRRYFETHDRCPTCHGKDCDVDMPVKCPTCHGDGGVPK